MADVFGPVVEYLSEGLCRMRGVNLGGGWIGDSKIGVWLGGELDLGVYLEVNVGLEGVFVLWYLLHPCLTPPPTIITIIPIFPS